MRSHFVVDLLASCVLRLCIVFALDGNVTEKAVG